MFMQSAQEVTRNLAVQARPRRWGIAFKIIALAVFPLLLVGLALLAYLALAVPRAYERVVRDSGRVALELLVGTLGANPSPTDLLNLPHFAGTPLGVINLRIPGQGNAAFINDNGDGRFSVTPFATFTADWSLDVAQTVNTNTLFGGQSRPYMLVGADVYQTPQGLIPHYRGDPAAPGSTAQKVYSLAVGLSTQLTQTTLNQQMVTLLTAIVLVTGVVLLLAFTLARRLVRPIVSLAAAADRLSLGEIESPIQSASSDELGDLAQALERIRLSLRTAMARFARPRSM